MLPNLIVIGTMKSGTTSLHLRQYLPFYSESNIFVITLEELNSQPQQTLQAVFRFLGVDDSFYHPDYMQKFHASSERRLKNRFGLFLTKMFRRSKVKDKIRSALPRLSTGYIYRCHGPMSKSRSLYSINISGRG